MMHKYIFRPIPLHEFFGIVSPSQSIVECCRAGAVVIGPHNAVFHASQYWGSQSSCYENSPYIAEKHPRQQTIVGGLWNERVCASEGWCRVKESGSQRKERRTERKGG